MDQLFAASFSFFLSLSIFHPFFDFWSFVLSFLKNMKIRRGRPMQDASAGFCNRMWNLVIYLYKPSDTHTVFSVLQ